MRRDGQQVVGAHPGGQQRLVRVAEGGVGDRQRRLRAQRGGEALRAERGAAAAGTRRRRRRAQVDARQLVDRVETGAAGRAAG